jgi:hypothetical protein
MYSPLTTLTLTAYLFTWTATRLPMLTDRLPMLTNSLTDTLTDAVPHLLILSGLSQHPYCTISDSMSRLGPHSGAAQTVYCQWTIIVVVVPVPRPF